jgi:predicted ATPase
VYTGTGAALETPYFHSLLAEACAAAGKLDEALETADRSLSSRRRQGGRVWDAELWRTKGEILVARAGPHELKRDSEGQLAEAGRCFRQSLETSRAQEARSLELRAALSFARLMDRRNERTEALELLEPVYNRFSEGLAAPDLKSSRSLLQRLRTPVG